MKGIDEWTRNTKGHKGEEKMPKTQDKNTSVAKASNIKADQANNPSTAAKSQRSCGTSIV